MPEAEEGGAREVGEAAERLEAAEAVGRMERQDIGPAAHRTLWNHFVRMGMGSVSVL